ncbi:helix-turn-helix domain-containing protein [Ruminococcus sp.]|uniref:helix-turn-helix domain-containing protein n=1 Tax=Ruminococcus sp. TaxID=41978 RepID=UPI003A93221D
MKKNIHRNDFVVELTYHTKIRKESSLWIHLILHHHKKGQHLIKEERYYISIRLNIDHRSVYKIAKELHRPYNTIKQEVQCGTSICIQERILCVTAEQPQVITTAL